MIQKRNYKHYPKVFKEEAIDLVIEQGYSVPDTAKSLGIPPALLYKWRDHILALNESDVLTDEEREILKKPVLSLQNT